KQELVPAVIVERVDQRIRQLADLPELQTRVVYAMQPEALRASTTFTMNEVRFHYEALGGQKTGAFLDQRENYAAAQRYAQGEALDVFCYQGGFALHLARVCSHLTAVD